MGQYDNRFGNFTIGVTNFSYVSISLTVANSPLQLYWPDQAVDSAVANPTTLASWVDMTSDANGRSVKMPSAKLASPGQIMDFNNYGGHDIAIYAQDGTTLIVTVPTTKLERLVLIDNSTDNGSWRVAQINDLATAVTQITQTSNTGNIIIAPGGAQAGAVSYTFNVGQDLLALTSFAASTGIAVRTAANTWALRSIAGTNNQIVLTNGSGVGGNMTISLASTITGINNLTVGNINLTANTISSTDANGNINFVPQGTGVSTFSTHVKLLSNANLYFRNPANTFDTIIAAGAQTANIAYTWPTVVPVAGQALVTDTVSGGNIAALKWANVSTFGGATTPHALAKYFNASGTLENSTVLLDDSGNMTNMNSLVVGALQLGLGTNTNISTITGNLLLSPNGTSETYSVNNLSIRGGNLLKLFNTANTNFISIKSNSTLAATYDLQLPNTLPAAGQQLAISQTGATPTPNILAWIDTTPVANILINGAMDIWQKNTVFTNATVFFPNNNNTVTADRWKLLSDGNNVVSIARVAGLNVATGSSRYALQATVETSTKKFGFAQIIEASDTAKLLGKKLSFSIVMNASGSVGITKINVALLTWQGAADGVTGDFIQAWNGAGTQPTFKTNWTAEPGAAQSFTITSSPTLYQMNNVQITTPNTTNCAIFIYTDDNSTIAAGNILTFSLVKLELGQASTSYVFRDVEEELILSKRWFNKDLAVASVIGVVDTVDSQSFFPVISPVADATFYATVNFDVEMARAPTVVTYSTHALTVDMWSTDVPTVDLAANSAKTTNGRVDTKGFNVRNNSGGALTTAQGTILGHWYADSEFY